MTEIECCYNLGTCKNKVEFWVTKKNDDVRWWYGFCKDHFNLIIDSNEIELEQLQKEKARMYNQIINWEELGYHSKIHVYDKAYGDIKITIALKEYRKKKLQKYINKRKKGDPFACPFAEDNDYCSYYCDKCENHPTCDYWDDTE